MLFLTSVSLTRRPLATIHRQDTVMKIPEPEDEAEAHFWTTETRKDYIRRVRRALHFDHIASTLTGKVQHIERPPRLM